MLLVKCPNCGTELLRPVKVLDNSVFHIEAYVCPNCKHHFHVTRELSFAGE
jgi:predicted RNA-binding Zn-ribbon protein involved in translation (DUF1610 family)